ncbi:MAG: MGMT family protein [Candidatus Lokiarchaeota archaeon]|nr:MGMT family protein [Candidatus Lokiarchaeota archaeon]
MENKKIQFIDLDSINPKNIIVKLSDILKRYLVGVKIDLYQEIKKINLELPIYEKCKSNFSRSVIDWILNNINYGQISSYSEIGKKLNSKAYRVIGSILKKNSYPLIIPCHRIIKNNGTIGGFMGKSNDSWQRNLKKSLLRIEGIDIT